MSVRDTIVRRLDLKPSPGVVGGAVGWLLGLIAMLVVATPLTNDDLINHQIHSESATTGRGLLGIITHYTHQWMANEGRFFPGSLAWSYSLHWYVGPVVLFKLVLACLVASSVGAVGFYVSKVADSRRLGLLGVAVFVTFVQMRVGFDPVSEFAGLLPLVSVLVLVAVGVALSRGSWPWLLLAGLAYGAAVMTYETTVAFAPVLIVVIIASRRRWQAALPIAVPALVQTVIVLILRSQLDHPSSPAYTVSLDPAVVLPTLGRQLAGAIPLSQVLLGDGIAPPLSRTGVVLALLLVGVPLAVLVRAAISTPLEVSARALWLLACCGAWITLAAAGLVALTARWQQELVMGAAYLPVYFQYIGLALVVIAALGAGDRLLTRRRPGVVLTWRWSVTAAVSLVGALTFAANLSIVGATT